MFGKILYLEKMRFLTRCFGLKKVDKDHVKNYEFLRCDCLFPILNGLYHNGHLELTEKIIRKNTGTFFRKYWDRRDNDGGLNRFISTIYPLQFTKTNTVDKIIEGGRGIEGWQNNIIGKQEQIKIKQLFDCDPKKIRDIPEKRGHGKRPDYVINEGDEVLIEVHSDPVNPTICGNPEKVTEEVIIETVKHAKEKGRDWSTKKYKLTSPPKYFAAYVCHDPVMIWHFHDDIDYLKKLIKKCIGRSKVDGVLIWLGSNKSGREIRGKMMVFSKPGRMPANLNDLVEKHYLE